MLQTTVLFPAKNHVKIGDEETMTTKITSEWVMKKPWQKSRQNGW